MPFTVQDFRSKLKYGGTRNNLFEVVVPFPAVSGGAAQTEFFSFMCKAASLPGEELGIINVAYFGRTIKVPGDRSFPEWQLRVINDEGFEVRNVFEQWSNALNGHFNNLRDPAAKATTGYQVDATIKQYGKTGDVIKEYDMIGCWPSAVGPIEVSWEQDNAIEEFDVTMAYQWWTASTTR